MNIQPKPIPCTHKEPRKSVTWPAGDDGGKWSLFNLQSFTDAALPGGQTCSRGSRWTGNCLLFLLLLLLIFKCFLLLFSVFLLRFLVCIFHCSREKTTTGRRVQLCFTCGTWFETCCNCKCFSRWNYSCIHYYCLLLIYSLRLGSSAEHHHPCRNGRLWLHQWTLWGRRVFPWE